MGKLNDFRQVIAIASEMTVNYLKPTPLGKWLIAEGWEEKVEGREHYNLAEIVMLKVRYSLAAGGSRSPSIRSRCTPST